MAGPRLTGDLLETSKTLGGPPLARALVDFLDGAMPAADPEEEDRALATLPLPLRDLWVLTWLESEVAEGSLFAYFWNAHGRHAALAVEALERIGATSLSELLGQALALVNEHDEAWQRARFALSARGVEAMAHPYKQLEGAAELDALSRRFSDEMWGQEGGWGALLVAYLERARDAGALG